MTATVTVLSEFLLARIAEDEAAARRVDGLDFAELLPAAQVFGMRGLMMPAARMLAECEAKRQIVKEASEQAPYLGSWESVLQWLALPYFEHPDFRDEWRG